MTFMTIRQAVTFAHSAESRHLRSGMLTGLDISASDLSESVPQVRPLAAEAAADDDADAGGR